MLKARALTLLLGLLGLLAFAPRTPVRAAVPIEGKRVALVIGIGGYRNVDRLPNPPSDARLIARTLRELGFTVIGGDALVDLDRKQLFEAVGDFGKALAGADVGLFYYSGHGLQVQGTNWLVPTDANPVSPRDLDFQMVDVDLVLRQMAGAGTRLNLVLLDACRNNPFGKSGLRAVQGGLAEMHAPEGTLISYATQPGNVARDGLGDNSPYTKALAESMRRPELDIFRVFNEVGLRVKRDTGGDQQPWVSTSPIDGEFHFVRGPASEVQTAGLVRPPEVPRPTPPPAIRPEDVSPAERVRVLARGRTCAILDAAEEAGQVSVRGFARAGADWDAFLKEARGIRGIARIVPRVAFLPEFACALTDTVGGAVLASRATMPNGLVTVRDRGPAKFQDLGITASAGMVVQVDLFEPDGSVVHGPARTIPAGEARIDLDPPASAGPGPHVALVLVSDRPLALGNRPVIERSADYLTVLRAVLAAGGVRADLAVLERAGPPVVGAAAHPVPTTPKSAPVTRVTARPARCAGILERSQMGEPLSEGDRAFLTALCR